jgi:hypothetical protein
MAGFAGGITTESRLRGSSERFFSLTTLKMWGRVNRVLLIFLLAVVPVRAYGWKPVPEVDADTHLSYVAHGVIYTVILEHGFRKKVRDVCSFFVVEGEVEIQGDLYVCWEEVGEGEKREHRIQLRSLSPFHVLGGLEQRNPFRANVEEIFVPSDKDFPSRLFDAFMEMIPRWKVISDTQVMVGLKIKTGVYSPYLYYFFSDPFGEGKVVGRMMNIKPGWLETPFLTIDSTLEGARKPTMHLSFPSGFNLLGRSVEVEELRGEEKAFSFEWDRGRNLLKVSLHFSEIEFPALVGVWGEVGGKEWNIYKTLNAPGDLSVKLEEGEPPERGILYLLFPLKDKYWMRLFFQRFHRDRGGR